MVFLAIGIFAYREYRLTVVQDFEIRTNTFDFCSENGASGEMASKCFDKLKPYIIIK